jgi:hypothetical protein
MQANDYLEWQISYDTDSLNEPSVVRSIVLEKPEGVRYGCELVKLLYESINKKILKNEAFTELSSLLTVPLTAGIEELEKIKREEENLDNSVAQGYGFKRFILKVPNYIKQSEKYAVEIKIAGKQRAVGNQAMIYVLLPIKHCSSEQGSLIGRSAVENEKVEYILDRSNISMLKDAVLAFSIASIKHHNDLKTIFSQLCYK